MYPFRSAITAPVSNAASDEPLSRRLSLAVIALASTCLWGIIFICLH